MGCGATRSLERVAAALGQLNEAPLKFESVQDVPQGGVLLALPALLANGLLRHSQAFFKWPSGFYRLDSLFLWLALTALARIKSIEQLRYSAPGEWGKLLGLDRVPEVRTLRKKMKALCAGPGLASGPAAWPETGHVQRWNARLAEEWLAADPQSAGQFYIDGHVRVYHGEAAVLPRRYVAREKLCLRGTTDYWVNALDGQPFFLVSRTVDPGLLAVLSEQIVPRLEVLTSPQPTEGSGESRPRFTLVFDREGYSPAFFAQMQRRNIAVLTYHKFPGADWPTPEFTSHTVRLANGEEVLMQLAERQVEVGGELWMREVRKLSETGHQTSILSTNKVLAVGPLAASMFARWNQENFFRYMREHYNLDRLVEHGTEEIPGTTRVVNPRWREVDGEIRRENGLLQRQLALFGALVLEQPIEHAEVESYEQKKGQLQQDLANRQQNVDKLKSERKTTPRHLTMAQLPDLDRFKRLRGDCKYFVDTLKMIAYRAETAMASILREQLARTDDARSLLRDVYGTEADLQPDPTAQTLTVRLHHLASHAQDQALQHLCAELTATETTFPGTDLRVIYKLGSAHYP
jgi:hypothetical protein